ncbi:cytochrome b561 [Terrihabitans soli]|uniref:Cytochrome b561 n=1 Tax=Terrihabitans soli TaxID=708113 RepID=A0A6S6QSP2_9HYPH|nr:cytochrome b/b6 domain-containing protein [Terrihabitans soli]BCJ90967.1 cytochrome b561 [Terrihabitans soli]
MQRGLEQAAPQRAATIKVWDPLVRIVHWTVATGCFLNLFLVEDGDAHDIIGYAVLAAMTLRIVWGFVGPGHARFSDFVRGPREIRNYIQDNLRGHARRYIGHNPAAAVMMLALMALVIAVSVTGYMMGTDTFWGEEWLEDLHEFFANSILVLALLHALAAILESYRHKENLVWSMVTGRKRR